MKVLNKKLYKTVKYWYNIYMINFNKTNVNIISVFISSIIFLIIFFILNYSSNNLKEQNISENKLNETLNSSISEDIELTSIKEWYLEIKALNLSAPIKEMQSDIPDENYIGHFNESSILGNNVALIAYNFGKDKNYFANLKELKPDDEIIYKVNRYTKKYKVISNQIIEKESLNLLIKDNNENKSTMKLFTYVKDLDTKLRYVCAKEIIDI